MYLHKIPGFIPNSPNILLVLSRANVKLYSRSQFFFNFYYTRLYLFLLYLHGTTAVLLPSASAMPLYYHHIFPLAFSCNNRVLGVLKKFLSTCCGGFRATVIFVCINGHNVVDKIYSILM